MLIITQKSSKVRSKKLKSKFGLLDIKVPRDRKVTFEPEILPKRVNKSSDLEDMVISLYSKGMSNTDIENFMAEKMKVNLSRSSISRITDKVLDTDHLFLGERLPSG